MTTSFITLSQLNEQLKGLIDASFVRSFWVVAEIAQFSQSSGGHAYLDLIEKRNNKLAAKMQAVIWYNQFFYLKQKFGTDTLQLLKKGNKVLLRVSLGFHPVYGLKLTIDDLDPSVTMGELELRRLATIKRLQDEDLMDLNAQNELAISLQRVAVISSATAAGYGDFINQLANNPYHYAFHHTLFQTAMQGEQVEKALIEQLVKIAHRLSEFDVVVIIRGGGSKLDLEAFNNYHIAHAISRFPLPIITGIGHQQDETVADMVAHTSVKTPTAAAEFLIAHQLDFEYHIQELMIALRSEVLQSLAGATNQLTYLNQQLKSSIDKRFLQANHDLNRQVQQLKLGVKQKIKHQQLQLNFWQRTLALFDVEQLLKRGFSITRLNGKAINNAKQLKKGDVINTQFLEGNVESVVEK